ncbi:PEGA domain-containing protein [Sorangium sp. So ce315]|uniref:PEGA domain-containing protein n=1 Tax=Sorangium sp. So ce315 TaxID=3133299 RepID=UPI003F618FAF
MRLRSDGQERRVRGSVRWAAALVTVLASAHEAAAQPARAQPVPAETATSGAPASSKPLVELLTGTARAEYEAGLVLFQDRDYANAIIKFERAYELSGKEPRVLWDIALCQWHLKRYSRVLTTIEGLLHGGGPDLSAQERQDAEALIQATRPYVSRLELLVNEKDAEVFVDGRPAGRTPLDKRVLLDVGQREIRVSKRGFKDVTISRKIAGGGETALVVVLEKEVHRGRLIVAAGPSDLIAIDGRVVGRGAWEGELPSGGHTLRVTGPSMLAHQAEIMLNDDQVRRVDVRLTSRPGDGIERWLWAGGGAALLAGAVVAGVLVFRSEPPTPGTVEPGTVRVASRGGGLVVRFGEAR